MVFWTLIKLSKTYSSEVVFNVDYNNLEASKTLQSEPIKEIKASVVSTGFNLISYKLRNHNLKVDLNSIAHKNGSNYYYLPNNHITALQSQLAIETKVNRILQDTIFISLGVNKTKKVPVELDADFQFKLGYNILGEILVSPNFVTITGPETQLDTIDKFLTKKLKLSEIATEINSKVSLQDSNYKDISFSESEVLVTAKVDKFTEGSVTVPFQILNLPSNYSITTFPDEVEVIYQVALSNFNKITKENLKIVCDFKDSESNGLTYLIPELQTATGLITSVRIVPEKIEFLIENK
jgi:YbbR domain-containing protein